MKALTLTGAQRHRYAKIVLDYLDGDYTMDPLDAKYVANDVIAAYVEDQAARQAAMARVLEAARPHAEGCFGAGALADALAAYFALDATEQEAGDGNE